MDVHPYFKAHKTYCVTLPSLILLCYGLTSKWMDKPDRLQRSYTANSWMCESKRFSAIDIMSTYSVLQPYLNWVTWWLTFQGYERELMFTFTSEFTFAICYRPSACLSVCLSVCRLSVVCRLSSVTLVRPTQAVQIFGNISTALGTLAIHWHPLKISRRSS